MSSVLPFLGIGFVAAVVVAIFWWLLSLSSKPRALRHSDRAPRRAVHQPWGDGKAGGRGTR
jgi:hypothetical protein